MKFLNKSFFKETITKKIVLLYLLILLSSVVLTSISSYLTFQKLMDNQMSVIDVNTSVIKTRVENLYEKNTNIFELPDLSEKILKKDKDSEKILMTIEKNFPGYKFKIPTVEGTIEYVDIPKLIYDRKEMRYFFEITREISFSENLPFKSIQLSIKLNYYQIILKSLLLGTLIATIILIPFIIFFSNSIVKPILKISKGSKQIAEGNLGVQVEYDSEDEVGELARTFNYMSNELTNIKKIRDDLLATISHELRTPLARIKGYTELMLDLKLKKMEQDVYYKSILQEVDFLNNMIGEILEISRLELNKESLFPEETDFGYFLENLKKETDVQKTIQNVEYVFDYEYGLFCSIDVEKVYRVFQNIMHNSIKAKADKILISAKKENDWIIIKIVDNGIGIPADQLEIVFEKFYRVDKSRDRKTGGFGLGLAICKGIIKEHKGEIFFSKVEKGTQLNIKLPYIKVQSDASKSDTV
ncbi:MAG: HAMP domain-containing histidine kinase [Spirochaetes bacterium]|nr:HAMP domain-containing histidine kinase [Spirochaetota bacterium]